MKHEHTKQTLSKPDLADAPQSRIPIAQVMTPIPRTCSAADDLSVAARLMWDHDCGVVPVVDGAHRLVGIVTDRDLCMAAYTRGAAFASIRVGDVMTREVHACRQEEDLRDAQARMRALRVRRLPVIDTRDRVVGLLSLADLAQRAAEEQRGGGHDLGLFEVGLTLAAVSEPRRKRVTHPTRAEREWSRRQSADEAC